MYFLQEVAAELVNKIKLNENFCVICPNKRTIDYLKFYISKQLNKTIWSPTIINLSDLVSRYTDLKKIDELILMVELFKSFKKVFENSKYFDNYDFEKFFNIGQIILKDFNEIDNYDVDVLKIFANINDYEQINYLDDYLTEEQRQTLRDFFGHFDTQKISQEKEYFKELWSNIPLLYKDFTSNLINKKTGYNGMIIKDVCEKLKNNEIKFEEFDKYIFVGFNAITKTQKILFSEIQKLNKALFYWDYDNFYTDDFDNEAGLFVRQNLQLFSDDLKINRDKLLNDKKIIQIGFPLEIAQTKAIPEIFEKMGIDISNKTELAKTAIVLPDENLLFPLLHSLPPEISQINITVNFPFKSTSVFALLNNLITILLNLSNNKVVYYQDLINFLNHQILKDILQNEHNTIIEKVSQSAYFDNNSELISNHFLIKILFNPDNLKSIEILTDNFLLLLEIIFKNIDKEKRKIETEAIFQFYNTLLSVQTLFTNELANDIDLISTKIFLKFLRQYLSGSRIPFSGKSIDGLQVMTIMETRNLDFENLIILNLNENLMPHKASNTSLISEFMRKSFGLPILMYQDSIFAYLFYRLLHNSKNIVFTYSNLISDKSGEISRFIQQLKSETNLISEKYEYSEPIKSQKNVNFEIEKDDEIYQKLSAYLSTNNFEKKLSASSLNIYISCPIHFYFKYIAKVADAETKQNLFEIDTLKFGNILHNSLEKIYKPYTNKTLNFVDFNDIIPKINQIVNSAVLDNFEQNNEVFNNGINQIIIDVIKEYVKVVLEFDQKNSPFEILSVENSQWYEGDFDFFINDDKFSTKIIGIFDRIDKKDDLIRIIDYKTGSDELTINSIDKLFDNKKVKYNTKAIFQMLLYCLIYIQKTENRKFAPFIYKLRDFTNNEFTGKIKIEKEEVTSYSVHILQTFQTKLQDILSQIFDKNIPFTQTENKANCEYCAYINICGR